MKLAFLNRRKSTGQDGPYLPLFRGDSEVIKSELPKLQVSLWSREWTPKESVDMSTYEKGDRSFCENQKNHFGKRLQY